MDQEEAYQAIQKEDWKTVLSWLYQNKGKIKSDPLLNQAANVFASEFFRLLPSYDLMRASVEDNLTVMISLHRGKMYEFSEEHYKLLIVNLAVRSRRDKETSVMYARMMPNEPECQKIINDYERGQPQRVKHSQSDTIQITTQPEVDAIPEMDYRISLFKSNQEQHFYKALKRAYDSYLVYPNVAFSTLLDIKNLQAVLTAEERRFFYSGIIDCVMFDPAEGYVPTHFFELDSVWHDSEEAQKRDAIKNSIFSKAGIKLIRIRKMDESIDDSAFLRMIREVIQESKQ
ncbi:DUF2726 domain-containing protein [Hymenobacter sediminis]|uniref:DUF2726 domain-containing protein n=1 Tax=Hymenobacter sediminis TaxID=2218621 RepID=UPI000DA6BE1A|nr:DUF2726 domain-containing protein [Hymenobacter sediminis]RPD44118.1 DUF2726 domain-containing protein [Hymenobacter sediminis]